MLTEKLVAIFEARTGNFDKGVNRVQEGLAGVERGTDKVEKSLTGKLGAGMDKAAQRLDKVGQSMQSIGSNMSKWVTLPIVGAFTYATKASIDWETAFAGVRKTVDGSESEYNELAEGIRNMSKELPASANEIAGVAESAGQLGISKENILDFSRTIIDLGEATNMTTEQAATEMARFANIMGMPQDQFSNLGSTIVALGNNFATTESEIMAMSMRLAGTGNQVGLTESDVAALAATMSSVGIEAEAGGTAMSMVMTKINNAVANGGEELNMFAEASGLSADEFATMWENKPIDALSAFIGGLEESGANGENLSAILSDLGIKGVREADTILRLAGNSELLSDAVNMSSDAFKENTALSDEAAQRYETVAAKLAMLRNKAVDFAVGIGEILMPYVEKAIEFLGNLIDRLSGASDRMKLVGTVIAAVVAAMGPLLAVGGTMLIWLAAIGKSLAPVLTGISKAGGLFSWLGGILMKVIGYIRPLGAAFTLLSGPVGWVVAAIIALGTAFVVAYNKSETFRNFINGIGEKFMQAIDWVKKFITAIKGIWSGDAFAADGAMDLLDMLGLSETQIQFVFDAVDWIKSAFTGLKDNVKQALSGIGSFFTGEFQKIKDWWNTDGALILDAMSTNFDRTMSVIKTVVGVALRFVTSLFQTFGPIVMGVWNVLWPTLVNIVQGAWERIKLVIGIALDLIKGIISASSAIMTGDWTRLWEIIRQTASNIGQRVVEYIRNMRNNAIQLIQNLSGKSIEWFQQMLAGILGKVNNIRLYVVNGFMNMVSGAVRWIVNLYQGVTSWFANLFTAAVGKVTQIKNGVVNQFTQIRDGVIGRIVGMYNSVVGWFTRLWSSVTAKVNNLKLLVELYFRLMVSNVISRVMGLLSPVINTFMNIYNGVSSRMSALKDILTYIFGLVRTAIVSAVQATYQRVVAFFTNIYNRVAAIAQNLYNRLAAVFTNIYNFISRIVSTVYNFVRNKFMAVYNTVTQIVTNLYNRVAAIFTNIYNFLARIVTNVYNYVKARFIALRNAVVSTITNLYNRAAAIFTNIYNRISSIVGRLRNWVAARFNDLRNRVVSTLTNLYNRAASIFSNIYNRISSIVSNLRNRAVSIFNNMRDRVVGVINVLRDRMVRGFTRIYNVVRDKMRQAKDVAVRFATNMKDGAIEQFNKLADGARNMMDKVGQWIDNKKQAVVDKATSLGKGIANAAIGGFNKMISGINNVATKLGYSGNLIEKIPTYSTGTNNHGGGLAVVGDKGPGNGSGAGGSGTREIVELPNRKKYLFENESLINMPKGSKVYNNRRTEGMMDDGEGSGTNVLKKGLNWGKDIIGKGVNKAKSVASNVWSSAKDVGGKIWDYAKNPGAIITDLISNIDFPGLPKEAATLAGLGMKNLAGTATDYVKKLFQDAEGAGDGSHILGKSITQTFGRYTAGINFNGGRHYGVDTAHVYDKLLSPINGVVDKVWNDFGGGKSLQVKSGKKTWWFMHMSKISKAVGDVVKVGQQLGVTGNTGNFTTGPHLHTQVMENGVGNSFAMDPVPVLKNLKAYADGGIATYKQMAWLADGGFAESIISHDPAKRVSQEAIWRHTGEKLGFGEDNSEQVALLRQQVSLLSALLTHGKNISENTRKQLLKNPELIIKDVQDALNEYNDNRTVIY